jgi:hypothetical protein
MADKPKTKTIYRSSVTGELVKKSYAENHPRTTEKERVKVVPRGKTKK